MKKDICSHSNYISSNGRITSKSEIIFGSPVEITVDSSDTLSQSNQQEDLDNSSEDGVGDDISIAAYHDMWVDSAISSKANIHSKSGGGDCEYAVTTESKSKSNSATSPKLLSFVEDPSYSYFQKHMSVINNDGDGLLPRSMSCDCEHKEYENIFKEGDGAALVGSDVRSTALATTTSNESTGFEVDNLKKNHQGYNNNAEEEEGEDVLVMDVDDYYSDVGLSKFGLKDIWEVINDVGNHWARQFVQNLVAPNMKRFKTLSRMNNAISYQEWKRAAMDLDRLTGKEQWKLEYESTLYNNYFLSKHLDEMREARKFNDTKKIMFLLRSKLFRNVCNINNPSLYTQCNFGTKKLIMDYVKEVVYQLKHLARDYTKNSKSLQELIQFIRDIRQSYGHTALLLSGGGALGTYHIGVVKALINHNLLPKIISGTSAGSITAAAICVKTDNELYNFINDTEIKMDVFVEEDSDYPNLRKLLRLMDEGMLADYKVLRKAVRQFVGDCTFQEAFNRSGKILNISVSSPNLGQPPRLLNYLTAPHVVIWSAVCASCACPILYNPATLLVKNINGGEMVPFGGGEVFVDGSCHSDLPIQRISELFNVNQFIVSQINPHVVPIVHPASPLSKLIDYFPTISGLLFSEFKYRISQLSRSRFSSFGITAIDGILHQRYTGDITIVPNVELLDYTKVFDNPTPQFMDRTTRLGERATWEKLCMIQTRCEIENTLNSIHLKLRERALRQVKKQHVNKENNHLHPNSLIRPHRNSNNNQLQDVDTVLTLCKMNSKNVEWTNNSKDDSTIICNNESNRPVSNDNSPLKVRQRRFMSNIS